MNAKKHYSTSFLFVMLLLSPMLSGVVPAIADAASSHSGQARAVRVDALGETTVLADTGTLGVDGGAREASSPTGAIPDVLSSDALHATTVGQGNGTKSEASLGSLTLSLAGNTISADFVMAGAAAACAASGSSTSGSSQVSGLRVNGVPVAVSGAPNQSVNFLGGMLVINEQAQTATSLGASRTVNALHVVVNGVADAVIASARAGVGCGQ